MFGNHTFIKIESCYELSLSDNPKNTSSVPTCYLCKISYSGAGLSSGRSSYLIATSYSVQILFVGSDIFFASFAYANASSVAPPLTPRLYVLTSTLAFGFAISFLSLPCKVLGFKAEP